MSTRLGNLNGEHMVQSEYAHAEISRQQEARRVIELEAYRAYESLLRTNKELKAEVQRLRAILKRTGRTPS